MTVDYLMHKIFACWYWQGGWICCEISNKAKLVIYFFPDNLVSMYIKSIIWSIKLYEMIIILRIIDISCAWLANCCNIITSFNIILSVFERCRGINTIQIKKLPFYRLITDHISPTMICRKAITTPHRKIFGI